MKNEARVVFRSNAAPIALLVAMVLSLSGSVSATLFGQEPLFQRLDRVLGEASPGVVSPRCSDYEFVRRIHLDLTGRVPGSDEVRRFVADADPNKRAALIDRLLAGADFSRHFANMLDVMLLERRADKGVPAAEWQKYLFDSVSQNKPYDQLVREILSADGSDPVLRPAVKFYLDRDGEPNLLTRDIGRIFFGVDLQCAQCHDHPLIDDYYQADYYGLYAFLNRSFVFTDKKDKDKLYFAEKADGEVNFSSVFTKQPGQSSPRLPGGAVVQDAAFEVGEEYVVAPAENVRPVPKYSRRAQLATLTTNGSNRSFNRNIANRLWALMMGRGLVEPVDLQHAGNPPTNAQVLDLLADEVPKLKYDVRSILRELARTEAYQRSYDLPPQSPDSAAMASQQLAALKMQQAALAATAEQSVKAVEAAMGQRDAASAAAAPLFDEMQKANAAAVAARQASDKAAAALAASQQQLAAKQDLGQSLTTAATASQEAAKKLPEDKELAAAAEKFAVKATAVAAEVAAATKAVNDLMPPAKAAADALVAAKQKVTETAAKYAPVKQAMEAAKEQWYAAAEKARLDNAALKSLESRIGDAEQVVKLSTLIADLGTLRQSTEKAQADMAAMQPAMEKLAAELPQRQTEVAAMQKVFDDAAKQLAESTQQLNARKEIAKSLADAAAQADFARQKLPEDPELTQAVQQIKTRSDQQAAQVAELAKAHAVREQETKVVAEKLAAAREVMTTVASQMDAAKAQVAALQNHVAAAQQKTTETNAAIGVTQQAVGQRIAERFYASNLRALSPEQLAWSLMQVGGVVDSHRAAVEAELNKAAPLDAAAQADPAKMAERARQLEAGVFEKLKGNQAAFVNLFSTGAGQPQDYFATVDQALFFANGGTVVSWLAPANGNLCDRMIKLDDPKAVADELYMAVFSRKPTDQEIQDVVNYLAARPNEKPAAVQELAWGLVTSAEFRFNH